MEEFFTNGLAFEAKDISNSLSTENFESDFADGTSLASFPGVIVGFDERLVRTNPSTLATDGSGTIGGVDRGFNGNTFTFTFDAPINAFGIDVLGALDTRSTGTLTVSTNTGASQALYNAPLADFSTQFAGIIDVDNPFTSVTIQATQSGDGIQFDNLRFGEVVADPPATPIDPPSTATGGTIIGTTDDDFLEGNDGPDLIQGCEASDRIFGGSGDDTLRGDGVCANQRLAIVAESGPSGIVFIELDGVVLFAQRGGAGGGRGITIVQLDPNTGELIDLRTFDTFSFGGHRSTRDAITEFLSGLNPADLTIAVAVGDDGGLNRTTRGRTNWPEDFYDQIERFGASEIRQVGFRQPYAFVANDGAVLAEERTSGARLETSADVPLVSTRGGNQGNDRIFGGAGDDQIEGDGEDDRLFGGSGADTIKGERNEDLLVGGDGGDDLIGGGGADTLRGGNGADSLRGNSDDDLLVGGNGADTLRGGGAQDVLDGGNGKDVASGNTGDDVLDGGRGGDILRGGGGDDSIIGGGGADNIRGNGGADLIMAGGGADTVRAGAGNDTIYGGGGADRLEGGGGDDVITGRGGDDTLLGNGGADIFQFSASDRNDTILDFRQGQDQIEILSGARSFAGLTIEQDGANVLIGFGNGQVSVITDNVGAFDENDFIF